MAASSSIECAVSLEGWDMLKRRDVMALGASAAVAALARVPGASADTAPARLETRLFNFRDDVSLEKTQEVVASIRAAAESSGAGGFLIGQNFIPTPFPARFEWIYMIQFDDIAAADRSFRQFSHLTANLSSYWRNGVQCDLNVALPIRFADAPGVGVRHTVMFDFKPDASAEAQARNVAAIRGMGQLPMVRHYLVEENPAYVPGSAQMQWQVIGDFANADDYKAYSQAPIHLAIREDFTAHTSRVAFLDVKL
jgi:hypothetical protein